MAQFLQDTHGMKKVTVTQEEIEETKQPSAKCGLSLDPDLNKPTRKDILRQLETIENRWGIS